MLKRLKDKIKEIIGMRILTCQKCGASFPPVLVGLSSQYPRRSQTSVTQCYDVRRHKICDLLGHRTRTIN